MEILKWLAEFLETIIQITKVFIRGTLLGAFFLTVLIVIHLDADTITLGELVRLLQKPETFQMVGVFGMTNMIFHLLHYAAKDFYKENLSRTSRSSVK